MANAHLPDLDAIQQIPNAEMRFYASIGAAISLASNLEVLFLDIFEKATKLDRQLAARIVFANRNSAYRRDTANAAMQFRLKGDAKLDAWIDLSERIVSATGNSGLRNLAGHAAVAKRVHYSGGIGGAAIGGAAIGGAAASEDYLLQQNEAEVLAGVQKPRQENFAALYQYCRDLAQLIDDVRSFLGQL